MAQQILPIAGVPDELIRVLNDRFRSSPVTAAPVISGGVRSQAPAPVAIAKPILRDTLANRAYYQPTDYDGTLFVVSNRDELVYVASGGAWRYVAGEYRDAFAARPADLGTNDAGYLFYATDTFDEYRWDGSAWAAVMVATFSGSALYAAASGSLTLVGGTYNDVPGATLSLNRDGVWLVTACFDFAVSGADVTTTFMGQCVFDGTPQGGIARVDAGLALSLRVATQQWLVTVASQPKVAKLQAQKSGGAGAGACNATNTTITAMFVG